MAAVDVNKPLPAAVSNETFYRANTRRSIGAGIVVALVFLLSILVCTEPDRRDRTVDVSGSSSSALVDIDTGSTAWMLTSCALVFLMTPGLAFFYGGMVRRKNLISTLLLSFCTVGVVSTLWVIVGFSLAFGDNGDSKGLVGNPATYYFYRGVGSAPNADLFAPNIPFTVFSMFQMTFAVITPAIITGAVAERANFNAMMFFIALWSLFVYCPTAHMEWHDQGLIKKFGHHDFAGGTVVHMSSGWSALMLAHLLGKRGDKAAGTHTTHQPYVLLGTALLWFGWFGFNGGSALASGSSAGQAFLNTHIAASVASLIWLLWDYVRGRRVTAVGACSGAVVGLVGITPGCGFVTVGGALLIGAITAIICNEAMHTVKSLERVDDTLDVWAGHGLGGTVGMILTACFSTDRVYDDGYNGLFYGSATLFWHTLVVAVLLIPFFLIMTTLIYYFVNAIVPFRVSAADEATGLDSSIHGESFAVLLDQYGNRHLDMDGSRTELTASRGLKSPSSPVKVAEETKGDAVV